MSDKSKESNENIIDDEVLEEVEDTEEELDDTEDEAEYDAAEAEEEDTDEDIEEEIFDDDEDEDSEDEEDDSEYEEDDSEDEDDDEDTGEDETSDGITIEDVELLQAVEDNYEEEEYEEEEDDFEEPVPEKHGLRERMNRRRSEKRKGKDHEAEDGFDEDSDDEEIDKHDRRRRIKVSSEGEKRRKAKAENIKAARRREKTKKRIKNFAIVGVVGLFAVGVYLTRSKWVPKLEGVLNRPKSTVVNDGTVQKGNFPLTFNEGSVDNIQYTGSYLLCLDTNELRIYNEDGEEENSFNHNYSDPVLKSADKRMLIYDKGGSSLMVVSRTSETYSKTISNKIIMAEIADNNNIAVVTSDEKYAGIIYVYDENGKEIFKWSTPSRIMSVTFSEDGKGIYVTSFTGKDGSIQSVMRYFRFDSEDEYIKTNDLPTLALQAMETENGEYWVVGDTCFIKLDNSGNVVMQYDYPDTLADFSLSKSSAALVFKGVKRKSSQLVIFDSECTNARDAHIVTAEDGSPVRMHTFDSDIILLKGRKVDCYDSHGNLTATADVASDYLDFTCIGNELYFLDYREINKIEFTR